MQQEVRPVGAPKVEVDGNQDARDRLTKTASAMFSRLLPNNQIGHNKFVVYVDKTGHPRAVQFASDLIGDVLTKRSRRQGEWRLPSPPSKAETAP